MTEDNAAFRLKWLKIPVRDWPEMPCDRCGRPCNPLLTPRLVFPGEWQVCEGCSHNLHAGFDRAAKRRLWILQDKYRREGR